MKIKCNCCGEYFESENKTEVCPDCESELYNLQWELNDIDLLYEYGEDGFCDGFTKYLFFNLEIKIIKYSPINRQKGHNFDYLQEGIVVVSLIISTISSCITYIYRKVFQ